MDTNSDKPKNINTHEYTSKNIKVHVYTFKNIKVHVYTFKNIKVHVYTSKNIKVHVYTSKNIRVHVYTSKNIKVHVYTMYFKKWIVVPLLYACFYILLDSPYNEIYPCEKHTNWLPKGKNMYVKRTRPGAKIDSYFAIYFV